LDTSPTVSGVLAGNEGECEFAEAVVSHNGSTAAASLDQRDGAVDRPQDVVSVADATRMLGVGRARVYQLLDAGVLESLDTQPLQITLASVQRRLQGVPPIGAQLAPLSAWAVWPWPAPMAPS
jgi:hypothetical protein